MKRMPTMRAISALLIILTALATLSAQAEILALYEFDDVATSTDANTNTVAGVFAVGPGATAFSYSTQSQSGKAIYFNNDGFNQLNEAGAVAQNDYLSFDVSFASGYGGNCSNLSFYARFNTGESAGAPESYALYTSADSYASAVATGKLDNVTDTFVEHSIDLSGVAALQGVGATEFRLYLWTADGLGSGPADRTFRLDTFVLEGETIVANVPQQLAQYDINDSSASTDSNPNTQAGGFSVGPGVSGWTYSGAGIPAKSAYFSAARGFNSTNEAAAVSADDYLGFTVNGSAGYGIQATELSFYGQIDPVDPGAPESYAVYTSADGFSSAVATGTVQEETGFVFKKQTIDLTGAAVVGLSTEFRIYFWTANGLFGTSERDWRFDECELLGYTFETNAILPVAVADYTFDDTLASFDADPQTDAADLVLGSGVGGDGILIEYSAINLGGKAAYWSNSFSRVSESLAVASNDYLSINLSVSNGLQAAINELSFYTLRRPGDGGGGPNYGPDSYAIYTSQDNFAAPLVSALGVIPENAPGDNTFVQQVVDLSGLSPVPSNDPIEVRLYMFATNGFVGASNQVLRMENLTLEALVSEAGYAGWSNLYFLVEGPLGDDDSDGWNNLWEYGLGGNPTNGFIDGYVPSNFITGSTFSYVHAENDSAYDLVYTIEATDDLVSGIWSNITAVGTNALGGGFTELTNSVPTVDSHKFIRLTIELL